MALWSDFMGALEVWLGGEGLAKRLGGRGPRIQECAWGRGAAYTPKEGPEES